jgi:predicted O-methyltransferase YrrM
MTEALCFVDEHLLEIGTLAFHCEDPIRQVPDGRLPVEKPRRLVEDYAELSRTLRPQRIVELGVYKGDSTALLNELTKPEKLVSFELSAEPPPLLVNYIAAHELSASVRPYFGVNQGDRARLAAIVDAEFGDRPLDLVIDDASHLYEESAASFEALFPRMRPGGLYLIEDWRWQQQMADAAAAFSASDDLPERARQAIAERMTEIAEGRTTPVVPLTRLVLELVLARASSGDIVSDVAVGPYWAAIRRGERALDAGTFRVAETYDDHFNVLSSTE